MIILEYLYYLFYLEGMRYSSTVCIAYTRDDYLLSVYISKLHAFTTVCIAYTRDVYLLSVYISKLHAFTMTSFCKMIFRTFPGTFNSMFKSNMPRNRLHRHHIQL